MRILALPLLALGLAACDFGSAPDSMAGENEIADVEGTVEASGATRSSYGNGVVTIAAEGSVDEVMARLETALEDGGFNIVTKLDHQANAASVDLTMAPAQVIFFGKPEVGTHLMTTSPEAALDLPQRMAVYLNEDGETIIAYNAPLWLATRHDVTGQEERVEKIRDALKALAEKAASGDAAAADEESSE